MTDTPILEHLKTWVAAAQMMVPKRTEHPEHAKNIYITEGRGRYFNLCTHPKRRIAKKNKSRARKHGLPGVRQYKLIDCFPLDVPAIETVDDMLGLSMTFMYGRAE